MKNIILIFTLCLMGLFFTTTSHATRSGAASHTKKDIMNLVIAQARNQAFSPALALAVADVESDFRPGVISSAGARGVMQIMPKTGSSLYGLNKNDLDDPAQNIKTGIHFLNSLIKRYGRVDIALSHYNGGSSVRTSNGAMRIIPATRTYVFKVLERERFYKTHPLVLKSSPRIRLAALQAVRLDDFTYDSYPMAHIKNLNKRRSLIQKLKNLRVRARALQAGGGKARLAPARDTRRSTKIDLVRQWESYQ